jgi:hypothetical protein
MSCEEDQLQQTLIHFIYSRFWIIYRFQPFKPLYRGSSNRAATRSITVVEFRRLKISYSVVVDNITNYINRNTKISYSVVVDNITNYINRNTKISYSVVVDNITNYINRNTKIKFIEFCYIHVELVMIEHYTMVSTIV